MEGRVKFFNMCKGIGFIEADDREFFVHFSDVEPAGNPPIHVLLPDWRVLFEGIRAQKGYQSMKVVPKTRPGLIFAANQPAPPRLDEHQAIDLKIDSLGRIYAIAERPTSPTVEAPGHFRAYYVGTTGPGKIVSCNLNLPPSDAETAYVLLDQDKNPRRLKSDGIYAGAPASSYLVKVERTGNVRIQNIGRRHDHAGGHNWLILQNRFVYHYDLSQANEDSIRRQTPTSDLKRDNDGFLRGILRAHKYMTSV